MINSMTGFGAREAKVAGVGKISVELRSTNHKFLEIVLHLPEGFLFLEDKIKKEIESRIKRGRVTCVINIAGTASNNVFINKPLLNKYMAELRGIKRALRMEDKISIDTLIRLPGVLTLEENTPSKNLVWLKLKILLKQALNDLAAMRQREGRALQAILRKRCHALRVDLEAVKARFKKAVKDKVGSMKTDEERLNFLNNADIAEETDRVSFHITNFTRKLSKNAPMGKELDFIAQELQREANTAAAKSFDAKISAKVVQMKSQIEKIREQAQNIE